jgi:hypothetical protein
MSIYDKASLVHIPSGVKSGTLYNVLPNNSDGDFDFSRGSTGTRVNKDGLIETVAIGVPRLNYPLLDGVVQDCPTLLLEPSRRNRVPYSEQFDNAAWGKQAITVTANAAISPDGSQTADKIIPSAASTTHQLSDLSLISSQTCATSIFAKADGINTFEILDGSNAVNGASFNILNGTITNKGSGVGSMIYYGNGWYRCIVVSTTTGFRIYCPSSSGDATGDGTSGVLFWGAQIEAGSYATSYIPNSGLTVTRAADVANGAEATFNDSEGVLYANVADFYDSTTSRVISISDGTLNNRVFFKFYTVSNGIEATLISSSGGTNPQITTTTSDTSNYNKIALKYSSNGFNLWANGFELGTDTVTNLPNNLSDLSFDTASLNPLYGNTKELMTFNEALSDSELEALTSYSSFNEMATEQLYTIE